MNSPDRSAIWAWPETVLFFVFLVIGTGLFHRNGFNDPGTFWHIRVGEIILDSGELPTSDPFRWTHQGEAWTPQWWLADLAMALIYRAAGFPGLMGGMVLLLAGLYAWGFGRMRAAGVPPVIAAILVGFLAFAGLFHDLIRPLLFTLWFTAVTAAWLVDFDRGRIGGWGLARLIPLFALWTNLHGGVLGGIGMLGLCSLGWIGGYFSGGRSPLRSLSDVGRIVLIVGGAVAATLLNPFHVRMYQAWFKILGSRAMKQYVPEHQPLDPGDLTGQVIIAVTVLYLPLLLSCRWREFRITWLLPLVWLGLAWDGIRQGPLGVIVAMVVIPDVWRASRLVKVDSLLRTIRAARLAAVGLSLALGAVFVIDHRTQQRLAAYIGPDPDRWPMSLIPALRQIVSRVPPGTAIDNDTSYGGFLIFYAPELKITYDDRFELTGDEGLNRYMREFQNPDLRFHAPNQPYVLIVTGQPASAADQFLRTKPRTYRELARHPLAVLYERDSLRSGFRDDAP